MNAGELTVARVLVVEVRPELGVARVVFVPDRQGDGEAVGSVWAPLDSVAWFPNPTVLQAIGEVSPQ